ncbi:HNH endonuclease family protein [Streptomyces sp. TP-A0874]|uniref:HNH endonuclease family protein n=1 Tax=Streptomyces sp. TP-A0874 TaxID=549819 RepID=UPI000852D9C4|nr:HNH endonuclease family protein [Streptomyces sp. TP-A0874]
MSRTSRSTERPKVYARRISLLAGLSLLAGTMLVSGAPAAQASPPTPPNPTTSLRYLGELTEKAEGSSDGYSRDKFPHWINQEGNCDTREVVLKRDGQNVEQDGACAAVSGSWTSAYDGVVRTNSSTMDIDHIVPLAEAWRSGASSWTNDQRQAFANDLTRPQLIAVTDSSNRSKGDKDPAKWMPPSAGYHCTYARMWVSVKHHYKLSVDTAEKQALSDILHGC